MSEPFDPKQGPILVGAEVTGPARSLTLRLVLDTGATASLLSEAALVALGYDPSTVTDRVQMATGSAIQTVPRLVLTRMTALGLSRFGFQILAHTLPISASFHGILGLDFLRGHVLTIDLWAGLVDLQ